VKKLLSIVLILTMFSTTVMSALAEARGAGDNPRAGGAIPDGMGDALMKSVTASLLGESMSTVLAPGGESGSGDGFSGASAPVITSGYTQLDLQQLMDNCANKEDTDGDSLPDEVEKILGADPESEDSDQDQLDDLFELTNQLNPLEPDTNGDGMPDYTEIVKWGDLKPGEGDVDITLDTDGDGQPNVFDPDNDNDGVPDGLDLSPFSYGEPQDEYTITIKTEGNATYADFQIQPKDLDNLYKNIQSYDWPYDQEGNIQDSDYSRQDMAVKPVLEIETDHMPSYDDCIKYGIVPNKEDGKLYIPLTMVEENGKKVALQGRIFIPAGQNETTLKARLLWSMEYDNDKGSFEFQAQPSPVFAGKKEWEGAGADTWDLDGNGKPDVIVAGIVNGESSHSFWYTIGYDMDAGGNVKGWSSLKRAPVTFPGRAIDGGVALYDCTGDGKPEVLFESLEDIVGKDKMSYVIGYDLDEYGNVAPDDNGNPKWSPVTPGPQVLDINSGSGAAVADLDGSGKPELIFMTIDNPAEADTPGYSILWNFDIDNKNSDGRFNYGAADWSGMVWSNPIGWTNAGGDIEVADLDGNSLPDLVLATIDDPNESNRFRYYIAWNVNTGGANKGKPANWSGVNVPPANLGSYSRGCGIAIEDFDGDGSKDDILLLDADDPHGERNSFWYWVAMDFRQNNAAWVGQKTVDSAGEIPLGSFSGLENRIRDLNKNGLGDMLLGWMTSDGYFRYMIGWDINAQTQAKYWGPVKTGFSHDVNGYINGLGFDTFDINRNGKTDLFVLWNDGADGMRYRIGWDLNEEGNVTGGWYINQFASDIFNDYNKFDQNLKGLGVAVIDKDYEPYPPLWNYPDRVADVLIAVRNMSNNDNNYNYDTYTFVEYALDEAGHMVDPAWTKGQWSVYVGKPRDPDHFDPDDDEYEQYDKYDKYNMVMKRQYGIGLDICDLNGDGKQDAVMTTADGPAENQIRQFTFYNIEDRDNNNRPKPPDNVVTRPLEDYINSVNGLPDDEVFAAGLRKLGLGTCFYDITGNGNAEAISAMVEKEGGELVLNLFTAYDIQTSQVNILQEAEPFRLTGFSLEENGGGEAGIVHVQPGQTKAGAYEDAMLNYEVLRQKYLNELAGIGTACQVIDTDFDAPDPARTITSFTHIDEVNPFVDGFLRDLDGDPNYKNRQWPFIVAVTNSSRRLTLDNLEKWKVSSPGLTFDLTGIDFNETRLLQMKTYDFTKDTTLDTVDIIDLVCKDDGLGSGMNDQDRAQLTALLLEWNSGEIHLISVGDKIVYTPPSQHSKIYKYLAYSAAALLPFVEMSRINYRGTMILKELYANIKFSQNAYPLRYKNIYAYDKAFDSWRKAKRGLDIIPGNYRAVRTAIGKSPFRGLKGVLTNGASLSKILKWGSTAAILVQFGFSAYAGYQMAQQFEDKDYGDYAGSVYGALQATYAAMVMMVPIIVKSIIRGLAGTGIGLAIVVIVELSDFITYLARGKGWSQMAIEKIFNFFVGQGMDVSVDIKSVKDDITYENVPNGLFIVGSKVRVQSVWQGIVTDIFRPYYNSQSDIGENYMIPYVYYPNNSEYYDKNNKANINGNWTDFNDASDLRSKIDEPSYGAGEKWIKEDGLWTEITDYEYDNTLAFNALRINMPVKIVREYDYKMHKWRKKNGGYESGGFVTGSDDDATTMYFDVMPQGLTAFRSGFKLVDSYANNAETETQQQSRERVDRNEIVKLDPDGDGLMTWGTKEKTSGGAVIDTSPTNWDTDGDGVGDDFEVAMGMNPLGQDTDGDGLSDWWELYHKTSPRLVDDNNDGDYADDGDEDGRDTDGDGLTDKEELDGWNITFTYNGQSIAAHVRTNPLSGDTDGDGLTDKEEKDSGVNPASQYTPRPMLEGERWDLLWDGNQHAPSIKAEIPGEENAQDGQQYTRNLADYFEDLDGDPLTYTADVGEAGDDGIWRYTYRVPEGESSPVVTVTVAAYDNRGTGKAVQSFILSDTVNPVLTHVQLNISDGTHTWPNRWNYQNWDVSGADPGITVNFSEPVSPGPNFGGILFTDWEDNPVATTNTCEGNKLLVNPAAPLAEDKNKYTLVVPAGVAQDAAALASENGFEGSFTTRDVTGPRVAGTPAANTGVGPYDELTFTFHEDTKRSYPYQDAYIVQRVQVRDLPPAYEYQRAAGVDFSVGKLNLNTGNYEMKNTVTFTLGQDRGLIDNSIALDLPGYPYYKLRLEPGFVEDMSGNDIEAYEWPFATGDVNSPVLAPGADWGSQEGKPLITVNSATPVIDLSYNEALRPGVNFAQIRVEHETKQNHSFWSPFRDLDRPGLPVSDLLDEALKVPATVELDGNILRITITEQPLIQNYLYRIVVPKGALADANGTETSVRSEIFLTYGTAGAAPEVIWAGSLTNGQLIPGDDPALSSLDPGASLGIVFDMPVMRNLDVWNDSDKPCPVTLADGDGNSVPYWPQWQSMRLDDMYYALQLNLYQPLKANTTYTLTVPANTVESAFGQEHTDGPAVDFVKVFTTLGTLELPGVESLEAFGVLRAGESIYGVFEYRKYNNMFEGGSLFQWYVSDDAGGTNMQPIEGATTLRLEIPGEYAGKYLWLEVTPNVDDGTEAGINLFPYKAGPFGPVQNAFSANMDLRLLEVATVPPAGGTPDIVLSATNAAGPIEQYYNLEVGTGVTAVTVRAEADDVKSAIWINNTPVNELTMPLKLGVNPVTVCVTGESGITENLYTITINRSLDGESAILPEGFVEVLFTGNIYPGMVLQAASYFYDSEYRDEGASLFKWYRGNAAGGDLTPVGEGLYYEVTGEDVGYYLFVEMTPFTSHGIGGEPVLSPGAGPVMDSQLLLAQVYDLTGLSVNTGAKELINNFTPELTSYERSVGMDVTLVTVAATASPEGAAVKVNGQDGTAPVGVALNEGKNLIVITVERPAEGGAEVVKTYLVTVNRTSGAIPQVSDVRITGTAGVGEVVVGEYVYAENEEGSIYVWYIANTPTGEGKTIAATMTASYTIREADAGKYLFFEVQPRNASGILGDPVCSPAFGPEGTGSDTTAPAVADGTITTSGLTDTQVTLSWNKATDDVSAKGALQYLVYRSDSPNIDTVANAVYYGTAVGNYAADISTKEITGLTAGATCYFNVVVKDEAGNKTAYTMQEVTTASTPVSSLKGKAGVTIIIHGWNIDGTEPLWTASMQNAIIQNSLGGEGQAAKITVTGTRGNLSVACDPWDVGLAESANGQVVVRVDWSAVANNTVTEVTAQEVAASIVQYVYNGQNGQPPLSELPIHLIGHSRGGGMVYELARLLGEQGIEVEQLTSLDPHPLTAADPPGPSGPTIDTPIGGVPENVLFADNYWQNIAYPEGQAVAGAYNREFTSLPGGYHNSNPFYSLVADHLNIVLLYQGTIDPGATVSNGEATMGSTERASWFNAYEDSGAKTGFYYSSIGGGDRKSTDTPVPGGDQVTDGYHNDPLLGGAGSRQPLNWANAVWPNVITLDLLRSGSPLEPGTQIVTPGETLDLGYTYRDYAGDSTVAFYVDQDSNPYNNNNLAAITSQNLATTGANIAQSSAAWNITELSPGGKYYVYAKITDDTRTRYLYAAPELQESAAPAAGIASTVPTSLTEAAANDGSLTSGTVVITIANGTLADPLVKEDVTAANMPAGLDYTLTRDSDTRLTITISGNADNHANADDISDLTFTIAQAKVTGAESDLTTENISIDFNDPAATAPDIAATPEPVNFGDVPVGSSADQVVTVKNDGDADLNIGQVTAPGSLFSIIEDNVSNQTLAPGQEATLTVRFAPLAAGPYNDSFNIPSNDPDENPVTVNLSGNGITASGPDLTGSFTMMKSYAWGKAVPGQAVMAKVLVRNTGNAPAGRFKIAFYLSDDTNFDPGADQFLRSRVMLGIGAGKDRTTRYLAMFRNSLSGKYLLCVIDSTDRVAESNENNNVAAEQIP